MPLRRRRFWSADLGCRRCRWPGCMSRILPVPVSLKRPLKREYTFSLPPVCWGFRWELDCRYLCVAKLLLLAAQFIHGNPGLWTRLLHTAACMCMWLEPSGDCKDRRASEQFGTLTQDPSGQVVDLIVPRMVYQAEHLPVVICQM